MSSLSFKSYSQTSPLLFEFSGYSDTPQHWQPKQSFDFSFIQVGADDEPHIIETDVVIVGSGCGGGVSARNLAEAGHKVLVVDKAYHYPAEHLPMSQEAACAHLFDNGGFFMTEDAGATVTAGSAWGGGGTVNWSVCLKPQDFVRKEWADAGLPFFTSSKFDECLDRVWEFQGAGTDQIRHNHRNKVLLNGSSKLGWASSPAPVNTGGREHFCGQCHLGCGLAEKRGPATSWLPDAAKAGAQFMEGFQVDKVIFDSDGQTAIGVEGDWTSRDSEGGVSDSVGDRVKRRVVVKAKKVILAAGSIWSPLVLMKSGITVCFPVSI
jgi:choline dehydrogenase-like flavoprotein